MIDHSQYRLALLLPQSRMLLACCDGEKALTLPQVRIQTWTRPAQQLTQLLKEKWNLATVLLSIRDKDDSRAPLAVLEVRTNGWQFENDGLRNFRHGELEDPILTAAERDFLTAVLEDRTVDDPFSRLGWIDEAQRWIADTLPGRRLVFSDDVRQLNAGERFALIRFATFDGDAYWLKAAGSPNAHEFSITTTLARRLTKYLPPLVASREDWNAWVMEDAGAPLSESLTATNCLHAIRSLAALQLETIPHTDLLLKGGCIDSRLAVLRSNTKRIISFLQEAMEQQISSKVPSLSSSRLRDLGSTIEDVCWAMESLGIPDSLIHIDANPGNVLISGSRCVFTDWAEAGIGNPFLTFEVLSSALAEDANIQGWVDNLKAAYRETWAVALSPSQIDRAFGLAPLLAIVAYLYGRGTWLRSEQRNDPHVQSYARGLARLMDRAARVPQLTEALCH